MLAPTSCLLKSNERLDMRTKDWRQGRQPIVFVDPDQNRLPNHHRIARSLLLLVVMLSALGCWGTLFRALFGTRMLRFLPMRFLLDRRTSWLRPVRMRNRGHRSCLRLDRTRMLHFMLLCTRRGLRHGMLLLSL
jgi:hypothetical protein